MSMPKRSLYLEKDREVEASVTITPAPGYTDYLKDKKIIRGIEAIVEKGIDGLKRENNVISDYKRECR